MNHYVIASYTLASLSIFALLCALALGLALPSARGRSALHGLFAGGPVLPLGTAWVTALVATGGSLYFSNVAGLLPCELCWFQRIFMYPLVLVLGVGLLRRDAGVWRYGLPVSLVGLVISVYHVLLQYNPALEAVPCSTGTPCSMRYLAVYGFVSIPVMAGAGFLLISLLLVYLGTLDSSRDVASAESEAVAD